jgi:hypothetical protein
MGKEGAKERPGRRIYQRRRAKSDALLGLDAKREKKRREVFGDNTGGRSAFAYQWPDLPASPLRILACNPTPGS